MKPHFIVLLINECLMLFNYYFRVTWHIYPSIKRLASFILSDDNMLQIFFISYILALSSSALLLNNNVLESD